MTYLARAALAAASAFALASGARAKTVIPPGSALVNSAAPTLTPAMLHIQEGTELTIRCEDDISSASASVGDRFTISSPDSIELPGGHSVPRA